MANHPKYHRRRLNSQVRPVHFEDFSGRDFERLIFAYALRAGWDDAQWLGESGGDHGRDVWCSRRATVFVCANYRALTFAKVSADLQRLPELKDQPREIIIACGGTVSATLREKVTAAAAKLGFDQVTVWSGTEVEERIRVAAPDLLARFCGGEHFPDAPDALRAVAAEEAVLVALSAEATQLLLAMAEAEDGGLLRTETHSGYGLSVGNRDFLPDTTQPRVKAKWQRAIRELEEHGLIEEHGSSGDIFAVTDDGYQFADEHRPVDAGESKSGIASPVVIGDVAQFFRDAGELIPEGPFGEGAVAAEIPPNAAAFLRGYPTLPVGPIKSELAAKQLAVKGDLRPMGLELGGRDWSRNAMGAICYAGPFEKKLTNFTQLFSSREICGVDLRVVHRVHRNTVKGAVMHRVLMIYRMELSCALALENFVKFSRVTLEYSGPLKIEAGIQGIKGCQLGTGVRIIGNALQPEQRWTGELAGAEVQPAEFLRPFYEQVWESFGQHRFAEAHGHLVAGLRVN